MRLGLMFGAVLAVAGCAAADGAGGDGDYMDDDLPMGNCSGGSGGSGAPCQSDSGGVPAGFPCGGTQECAGDLSCVAPFAEDEVGDFTCSAQCIANEDEAWWCLDAAACCDPAAVCTTRGLCVPPDALDDTAGDDTMSGTAGEGTASSGSTGEASTGTGSDTGTGDPGSGSSSEGSSSGGG